MLELLVLAIAPAILLLWYVYRKDRYEPEPRYLVARVFLLGALAVIPAVLIEMPFPPGLFTTAVVAPVVEEGLKFSVVFFTVYRLTEFDEPMDGIVYAAAAGLGFAAVENVFYVMDGGIIVGLMRGVLSVPGHMIFSCVWGFALGIAKFRPEPERARIIITGLAGAMLMHGVFNFSLAFFDVLGLLMVLLVVVPLGWWILKRNIERAQHDPNSAHVLAEKSLPDAPGDQETSRPGTAGVTDTMALPQVGPAVPEAGAHNQESHDVNGTGGFCTECGAPYKAGARFCRVCGRPLDR